MPVRSCASRSVRRDPVHQLIHLGGKFCGRGRIQDRDLPGDLRHFQRVMHRLHGHFELRKHDVRAGDHAAGAFDVPRGAGVRSNREPRRCCSRRFQRRRLRRSPTGSPRRGGCGLPLFPRPPDRRSPRHRTHRTRYSLRTSRRLQASRMPPPGSRPCRRGYMVKSSPSSVFSRYRYTRSARDEVGV